MHEQDIAVDPHSKTKHRVVEDERDQLGRRKWKLQHYEEEEGQRSLTALEKLRGDVRNQSFLVSRSQKLTISNKMTKQQALKKANKDGGFYCNVCRELYKCDTAYLSHLNSSSHNSKLGMSLKVEGVNSESVRSKLQSNINIYIELSQGKSRPLTIVERMMKADVKKEKNQEKLDEKQRPMRNLQQRVEIEVKQQSPNQQQSEEPEEKVAVTPLQTNPSTLQVPDQTELLMKSLGLPTSFKAKHQKKMKN